MSMTAYATLNSEAKNGMEDNNPAETTDFMEGGPRFRPVNSERFTHPNNFSR